MTRSERLLGFDARLLEGRERWEPARRELFLLRGDVDTPLSTDTMVWPSLFDPAQQCGQPGEPGLPRPEWIGANTPLWSDLGELRAHLDGLRAAWALWPYALVAVSWWSDTGFTDASPYGPRDYPAQPSSPAPAWTFLGYDVGDGSLLSGLSNCGYEPGEAEKLAPAYARELNEHHLFADLDAAFAFRSESDARIPEHDRFFVYALYEIERVAGSDPSG